MLSILLGLYSQKGSIVSDYSQNMHNSEGRKVVNQQSVYSLTYAVVVLFAYMFQLLKLLLIIAYLYLTWIFSFMYINFILLFLFSLFHFICC